MQQHDLQFGLEVDLVVVHRKPPRCNPPAAAVTPTLRTPSM